MMRVKRLVWAVLALVVALPGMGAYAQDSGGDFVLGTRVLVVVDQLPVYVQPDMSSTVVEELQVNMVSRIIAAQEDEDGTIWYYLRDNAYGWVPSLIMGGSPFVDYSDELLDQRIAEATGAIEANPEDVAAYAARGMAYASAGDYDPAIADYTRAIELDPENGILYDYRAKIYLNTHSQKLAALALDDLHQAIQYGRGLVNTYNRLGIANDNRGRFPDALAAYDQAIALEPGYGLIYNNIGVVYGHMGDSDQEIALYTQAVEIDPHLAFTYVNRGLEYHRQNRLQEAYDDFNLAIQADPFFARAYVWRGNLADGELFDDPKAAFDDFNRAVQLDPTDAEAVMNRGVSYLRRGELESAIADLETAVQIDGTNEMVWRNLGTAYAWNGQYDKALESYTVVIDGRGPLMASTHLYRAQIYVALGDLDSAQDDLWDYVGMINRSDVYFAIVGYMMEGNVYLYRGQYQLAAIDYEDAYEINPALAQSYASWVGGWRVTWDREDILADLESQLSSAPDNADLQLQVGNMYMEFGRLEDAMRAYDRYVALVGDPGGEFSMFLERVQPLYAPGLTPGGSG
jgi:tetratricopeptide (TPR) repeat protein